MERSGRNGGINRQQSLGGELSEIEMPSLRVWSMLSSMGSHTAVIMVLLSTNGATPIFFRSIDWFQAKCAEHLEEDSIVGAVFTPGSRRAKYALSSLRSSRL